MAHLLCQEGLCLMLHLMGGSSEGTHTHLTDTFLFFVHGPSRCSVIATGNGWILLWLEREMPLPTPQGSHI